MSEKKNKSKEFSRRDFLKTTGAATGGIIGGSLLGGIVGFNLEGKTTIPEVDEDAHASEDTSSLTATQETRQFFERISDFEILSAATEVIFPEDDVGPGAIALGVPFFIDKQLACPWGMNARNYMMGPMAEGETKLVRSQIFLLGLRKLNEYSNSEHDANYYDLDEDDQISLMQQCESDEIEMDGLPSSQFFQLLRQSTIEGVYSDPKYGGNRNKEGWRMKEFPGAYTSHREIMQEDNPIDTEFISKEPMGLYDTFYN